MKLSKTISTNRNMIQTTMDQILNLFVRTKVIKNMMMILMISLFPMKRLNQKMKRMTRVRSVKLLKTYIHIKSFPMEVAVESNIPQGFNMDEGGAAPIYRPNDIPIQRENHDEQEEEQVQPIYYEVPMPKQQEHHQPEIIYQPAPPKSDTVFSGISPLVWMVIVFVAFILGFFMGMGAGGRNNGGGQAAPIILTSGRGV